MPGPFDDGLNCMELSILLAATEELSEEEKMLADLESELHDEDILADDRDLEDEEDSRPLSAEDIF